RLEPATFNASRSVTNGMQSRLQKNDIRVCHVAVADLWAGAEVQLRALIAELVRMPNFTVSVVLFNRGRLAEELAAYPVEVQIFSEMNSSSAQIGRSLWRYFRQERFDIVHTHKHKDTILGAPVARWSGVPHVVRTVHGLGEPFSGLQAMKMGFYESVERLVHRWYVERLIAVSSEIECHLRQTATTDVMCIRNGIDLNSMPSSSTRSVTRKAFGVADDICLIGSVGRLTPVKGFAHVLRSIQILAGQGLPVIFWLVGEGPLKQELQKLANELEITDRVMLLGHRDDAQELMEAMDVFVLPSLHEGIPMALLEAMGTPLPVVASRVGGIPEVIEDGVSGLLVEAGDPVHLAEVCRRVISDADLSKRLAQAAKRRVEERFSSSAMAAKVVELYRELVGKAYDVERQPAERKDRGAFVA
ncbi:MAG TPA: glycosyltransferase, partial [Nitrospira sp.]|nr:glycosyltransferase [Nitrospira sp.]